ncbi:MAG TPA: PHP domain-containing protein, partial [Phycisphaerae bacterium]|nr:PHP domain-containing protein [Phycisphaerae bacterium]
MPQSFTGGTPMPHQAAYAELHCLSNFSFLRGASHAEELVARAAELGYAALAITDRNSLAGVVRAHVAAKEHGLHLVIGAEITPVDAAPIVLLAPNRVAYGRLARLITRGRLRCRKGACEIRLADVAELGSGAGLIGIVVPAESHEATKPRSRAGGGRCPAAAPELAAFAPYGAYRAIFGDDCFLAAELAYDVPDAVRLERLRALSEQTGLPLVAANDVHYHVPERRYLQDVLTCIREKCTLTSAGRRLLANAERHLRPRDEIARRYAPYHELLQRTVDIARRCTFSLDELRYEYPHELVPPGVTAHEYLTRLTWAGARERYGRS